MYKILLIVAAFVVSGCSVTKTVVETHPETQYHIDQNSTAFIQLVNTIRLNSNVKKPSADLRNQINQLVFQAGLVPQCSKTDGCYLVRPGFNGKIRIEPEYILVDFSGSYVKIEDVNQAANLIYG
jgi:hypothetical protein